MSSRHLFILGCLFVLVATLCQTAYAATCLASIPAPIPAVNVIAQPSFDESTSAFKDLSSVTVSPVSGKIFTGHSNAATKAFNRFATSVLLMNGGMPELTFGDMRGTSNCSASLTGYVVEVHVDQNDVLYAADIFSFRVATIESASTITSTSPSYSKVYGQPSFTVCTRGTTLDKLNRPSGIYVDNARDIMYISDYDTHNVFMYDSLSTKPSAGAFADRFIGGVLGCSDEYMRNPYGITVDKNGHLWVADYSNDRVLRFNNAHTLNAGSKASLVVGQPTKNSCPENSTPAQNKLRFPFTMTFDLDGNLYVADGLNSRVMTYINGIGLATDGALADLQIGQESFDTRRPELTPAQNYLVRPRGLVFDQYTTQSLVVADGIVNRLMRYCSEGSRSNTNTQSSSGSVSTSLSDTVTRSTSLSRTMTNTASGTSSITGTASRSISNSASGSVSLSLSNNQTRSISNSNTASISNSLSSSTSLSNSRSRSFSATKSETRTPTNTAASTKSDSITRSTALSATPSLSKSLAPSVVPVCGNGIVEGNEECDPPNLRRCCNSNCKKIRLCIIIDISIGLNGEEGTELEGEEGTELEGEETLALSEN
jgi:hypothetical protein